MTLLSTSLMPEDRTRLNRPPTGIFQRRTYRLVALCLACFLLLPTACSKGGGPRQAKMSVEKTRPLTEVAAGDQYFSSYKPANPYVELVPGVLTRTLFRAAALGNYQVEVRDIRVASGKKGENLKLDGAAFLQVQSGTGAALIEGKRQDLSPGATFSVPQGQALTIESSSGAPLILRVELVKAV
jgi:hypothetical protein